MVTSSSSSSAPEPSITGIGGYQENENAFPFLLHSLLEDSDKHGFHDIISWLPCGKGFKIHDRDKLVSRILPSYFSAQSMYRSFHRQLNLYNFVRYESTRGGQVGRSTSRVGGSYSHPDFQRGAKQLCHLITRKKGNTTKTSTFMQRKRTISASKKNNKVHSSGATNADKILSNAPPHRNNLTTSDPSIAVVPQVITFSEERMDNKITSSRLFYPYSCPPTFPPLTADSLYSGKYYEHQATHQVDLDAASAVLSSPALVCDSTLHNFLSLPMPSTISSHRSNISANALVTEEDALHCVNNASPPTVPYMSYGFTPLSIDESLFDVMCNQPDDGPSIDIVGEIISTFQSV